MTGKKLGRRSAAPVQSTELDLTSSKNPRQEPFLPEVGAAIKLHVHASAARESP